MILPDSLWVLAVRAVIIIIIIITGWRSIGLLRERIRKYFLWEVCHYLKEWSGTRCGLRIGIAQWERLRGVIHDLRVPLLPWLPSDIW